MSHQLTDKQFDKHLKTTHKLSDTYRIFCESKKVDPYTDAFKLVHPKLSPKSSTDEMIRFVAGLRRQIKKKMQYIENLLVIEQRCITVQSKQYHDRNFGAEQERAQRRKARLQGQSKSRQAQMNARRAQKTTEPKRRHPQSLNN